jgi:hypothetical protein
MIFKVLGGDRQLRNGLIELRDLCGVRMINRPSYPQVSEKLRCSSSMV